MERKTKLRYIKVWFLHADGTLQAHDVEAETRSEGESKVLAFYGTDVVRITGSLEYWTYSWLVQSLS